MPEPTSPAILMQRAARGAPALLAALAARYATLGYDDAPGLADVATLRDVLAAHLATGQRRAPGTAVARAAAMRPEGQRPFCVLDVVTDDGPFLLDSLVMALTRIGLRPLAVAHPVLRVARAADGTLTRIDGPGADGLAEAWLHAELPASAASRLPALEALAVEVMTQARAVAADWAAMRAHLLEVADILAHAPQPVPAAERDEAVAFLHWLAADHFTFIGAQDYALRVAPDYDLLRPLRASALGLLRPGPGALDARGDTRIPAALRDHTHARALLVLTKSSVASPLHRPTRLDYVGVRRFDARGRLRGEWRFLGLYTSSVYQTRPADIPLVRRKVAQVHAQADLPPGGHAAKALNHILDTLPREEMLQASPPELADLVLGLLAVHERRRLRLFIRREVFGRFATALLYVPRDRYRTELRETALAVLMQALDGIDSEFSTQFSESAQVRVYFVIHIRPGAQPRYDTAALERTIGAAMLTWTDRLEALFEDAADLPDAVRWLDAFPPAYQDDCSPDQALADLRALAGLDGPPALALDLVDHPDGYRLRVRGHGRPPALSDTLPPLERFGLRVVESHPYALEPGTGPGAFVQNLLLAGALVPPAAQVRDRFLPALARVLGGHSEDDGLNRLVLSAGLDWREVTLVRAIVRHLVQLQVPFSPAYLEQGLARHGALVRRLVDLHHLRLDPAAQVGHAAARTRLEQDIAEALDAVVALDDDRILRRVHGHILAMVRTTYFKPDPASGQLDGLAFKLDPRDLPDLPEPRPWREVFVYHPDVEGVHLRGGPVARGGIRHSDRREDFRTEVLGLMKAQMVKNAVIVPVGAKGGFVVKRALPDARADRDRAVRAAYTIFIRGLLDLTDNRAGARVVPPAGMVRHDGDDPYLVVAADKGTAAFSDLANTIAAEYGFWLGDAFASGGAKGYDHKAMGITARGAWESVRRHFRDLGIDYQNAGFTAVGIGDMSGDVFGNGLLYTDRIRLVAAFDHRHIFLDPDPDPARSHAERARLFALARSSWADYDRALISRGGGVYPRDAKSIALGAPVRRALGVSARNLTPAEIVQAILRAPVDLLWNGGIGTYVKASDETHAQVGDRANDALRVNGAQLRCKVVGEGGNLGFTQRGRIEYARTGGRINTDAIDNSAGVDASDHEVNLKILLDSQVRARRLTGPGRDRLLRRMTAAVAAAVVADNHGQALVLSVEAAQGQYLLGEHARLLRTLERRAGLRRDLEHLPSDAQLETLAASGGALTRPELAVLLAHAKLDLFAQLTRTDLLADPELAALLALYFPPLLRHRYAAAIARHPLGAEILATMLGNRLLNAMGPTFIARLEDETGAPAPAVVRAAGLAARLFDLPAVWEQVSALDDTVAGAVQVDMLVEGRRLLERASAWLVRHPAAVAAAHASGAPLVAALRQTLADQLNDADRLDLTERGAALTARGVPPDLAAHVAALDPLYSALDIGALARWQARRAAAVAGVYHALAGELQAPWLRGAIRTLPRLHHLQRKARAGLRDELYVQLANLTAQVLAQRGGNDAARLAAWRRGCEPQLRHYLAVMTEIRAGTGADLAGLTVAVGALRALAQASPGPA